MIPKEKYERSAGQAVLDEVFDLVWVLLGLLILLVTVFSFMSIFVIGNANEPMDLPAWQVEGLCIWPFAVLPALGMLLGARSARRRGRHWLAVGLTAASFLLWLVLGVAPVVAFLTSGTG